MSALTRCSVVLVIPASGAYHTEQGGIRDGSVKGQTGGDCSKGKGLLLQLASSLDDLMCISERKLCRCNRRQTACCIATDLSCPRGAPVHAREHGGDCWLHQTSKHCGVAGSRGGQGTGRASQGA